ncbi:MAG: hypothetical protein WDO73_34545 [Ignavibacteriota bacterium]
MVDDALTLCRALGYDLNTVEFAVENGVPYAIDFMNPAPDAGIESVGAGEFPMGGGSRCGHGRGACAGSPGNSGDAVGVVPSGGNRMSAPQAAPA